MHNHPFLNYYSIHNFKDTDKIHKIIYSVKILIQQFLLRIHYLQSQLLSIKHNAAAQQERIIFFIKIC